MAYPNVPMTRVVTCVFVSTNFARPKSETCERKETSEGKVTARTKNYNGRQRDVPLSQVYISLHFRIQTDKMREYAHT